MEANVKSIVLKPLHNTAVIDRDVIFEPGEFYITIIRADGSVTLYPRENVGSVRIVPVDAPELDD